MIVYAPVVSSAVVVPIADPLLNKVTVLPASATPSIVGVESLVSDVVVVIDGWDGAVVSTVRFNALDTSEIFPASSVATTVKE